MNVKSRIFQLANICLDTRQFRMPHKKCFHSEKFYLKVFAMAKQASQNLFSKQCIFIFSFLIQKHYKQHKRKKNKEKQKTNEIRLCCDDFYFLFIAALHEISSNANLKCMQQKMQPYADTQALSVLR